MYNVFFIKIFNRNLWIYNIYDEYIYFIFKLLYLRENVRYIFYEGIKLLCNLILKLLVKILDRRK